MITEDYVKFETAQLLEEKGFDETCFRWADTKEQYESDDWDVWNCSGHAIGIPTLQKAMKWLREVHHIIVAIDYDYEFTDTSYCYKIYQLGENGKPERVAITGVSDGDEEEHIVGFRDYKRSYKDYATYEDAADDGIRYCLENLI